MPKLKVGQTNFSAGEFSPLLAARSDVSLYRNGAATLRNFRLHYQGGATMRDGTRYLATLGFTPAKLVPFVFNTSQVNIFALSDTRAEIFDSTGALIQTLTGAPWTSAMLDRLNWAQQGDTLILVHPDMPMQVILRTSATTFTRAAYAFETVLVAANTKIYQPYFKFAPPTMTLTPSATTGAGITLTLSAPGIFVAGHIGTNIRYKGKQILVTAVASLISATGTVVETLPATTADVDWDEAVFSPVRGYANSVVWFSDRLWFGGSKSHPIGIWGTKTGAYFNFDVGTALASEAIWENAPASRNSEIRHLLDFRHLIVYADRGLFYVPSSPTSPIVPANMQVLEQQPYGASYVRPQSFDGAAAYVQETSRVAREGFWVDTDQAYTANPISGLASHLLSAPTEIAVSYGGTERDEAYLFLVNGDGKLLVFHSNRAEKMAAWVAWETAGTFRGIATTPGKIFVTVERALAAGTVTALEIFDEARAPLDCLTRVTSGGATRVFAGFNYINGKTVDVVTKGHYLGQFTVTGNSITLADTDPAVTEIEAGFGYDATLRPMPAGFDLQDGPARGRFKRLINAIIEVDSLQGLRVQGRDWLPDFQGDDYASQATVATKVIQQAIKGASREGQFDVVIPRGRKGTILSLAREMFVGD